MHAKVYELLPSVSDKKASRNHVTIPLSLTKLIPFVTILKDTKIVSPFSWMYSVKNCPVKPIAVVSNICFEKSCTNSQGTGPVGEENTNSVIMEENIRKSSNSTKSTWKPG